MIKHDEKKIEERLLNLKCINGALYFGSIEEENRCYCGEIKCENQSTFDEAVRELLEFIESERKQYAEHMVLQERERIIEIILQGRYAGVADDNWTDENRFGYNKSADDIIKAINQE